MGFLFLLVLSPGCFGLFRRAGISLAVFSQKLLRGVEFGSILESLDCLRTLGLLLLKPPVESFDAIVEEGNEYRARAVYP